METILAMGLLGVATYATLRSLKVKVDVNNRTKLVTQKLTIREYIRQNFSCNTTTAAPGYACKSGSPEALYSAGNQVLVGKSGTWFKNYFVQASCNADNIDVRYTDASTNKTGSVFNNIPLYCPTPGTDIVVRPVCSNNISLGYSLTGKAKYGAKSTGTTYRSVQDADAVSGLGIKLYAYNSTVPQYVISDNNSSFAIRKAVLQDFKLPGSLFANVPNGEYRMIICHRSELGNCAPPDCGNNIEIARSVGAGMHGYTYWWDPANAWWRPSAAEMDAVNRKEICPPIGGINDIWTYMGRFSNLYKVSGLSDNIEIKSGKVVKARALMTYYSYSTAHKLQNKFALDEQDASRGTNNCTIEATPLIIDLGDEDSTAAAAANWVTFDLDGKGTKQHTTWLNSKHHAFLALDRDGSGCIENGSELFGEYYSGAVFEDGFKALETLDENHDGKIDALDKDFSKLRLWQDAGTGGLPDGTCDKRELKPLAAYGIESISLESWGVNSQYDFFGSRVGKVSRAFSQDKTYRVLDVSFQISQD